MNGKKITAQGVKAVGAVQWQFEAYYLYGAVALIPEKSLFLEFPYLIGDCFQIFLDKLSRNNPDNFNVFN